ncbi:MAG: lipoyl(octanoyl) transferase LipB [Cardiobacteriaceae bacterium]|nr:lipoyl(octanoyl) transferase LipB [Cardiobacteriaceae bacterium]
MVEIKQFGLRPYMEMWDAMRAYTEKRDVSAVDQIWLVQHPSVFTQGLAGKAEHVIAPGDIPIIHIDRGGQVTYHGSGQIIMYLLLDIRREHVGIRQLINMIENSVINFLGKHGVEARSRLDAPGVYVEGRKIASLGLRIRKGCTYHGVALNVDMDLSPFKRINPCGLKGIQMTQLRDCGVTLTAEEAGMELATIFREEWQRSAISSLQEVV